LLAAKQIKNMADKSASTHQNGNIVEAKRDSNTNVKDTAKDPQDANGNDNENGHANAKGNKNGNGNAETPNQNDPSQHIKAPPVCRVPALRKMNMPAEALSELCFEPEDVLDGTLTNKSTSNGTVTKDTNGQNNEKFNHNDDDDGMTSDQWAEFKNSILKRTESRNGRDHQRFDNDAKTGDLIRLTTGSVPIMKDGRILLVSSSRKEEWILPKGGWESDENIEVSALRETYEEGGILGTLGPQLKAINYETRKAKKRRLEMEASLKKKCEDAKRQKMESETTSNLAEPTSTSSGVSLQSAVSSANHSEDDTVQGSSNGNADVVSIGSATSYKSDASPSSSHVLVRMTMFPLYVLEVREHWPESGRARKVVDIDTAIEMMKSRPEFHEVLIEVKEKGLHLKPHRRIPQNGNGDAVI
jgi:ADP-ribose pyrophosphatase YjhB (NUDIX family)